MRVKTLELHDGKESGEEDDGDDDKGATIICLLTGIACSYFVAICGVGEYAPMQK
jgi:hypothetical protein